MRILGMCVKIVFNKENGVLLKVRRVCGCMEI